MASDVRIKLLQLVLHHPEIKRDDIRAHKAFEDEEDRTLANLLYNCKKDEQLVADESLRYTITAKGRAYLKAAGVDPTAATAPRDRAEPAIPRPPPGRGGKIHRPDNWKPPPPESNGNGAARGIAQKLLADSQAALDEYIASVCDPRILDRFKAARDQARELVGSLDGAGDGSGRGEHE